MPKRQAPSTPCRQSVTVPFTLDAGGVREVRIQRAAGDELEVLRVEGHASVFGNEYKVYGGPPWGWIETIMEGAFDETLGEDPDVVFLRNHQGLPLARTKSATLELEADDVGLAVRADLDLANPEVQALSSGLVRGDVDEMSFAFRVTEQMWAEHPDWEGDEMSLRRITAVNIHRGDVSVVTFGANEATDVDVIRSLERLSERELLEARAVIERRIGKTQPGGMPGQHERGGTPPDVLALLQIPANPALEEYFRESCPDPGSAAAAGRAS
jgi:HK97 family phage prohead protease